MQYPTLGILILNHNGRRWLAPLYRSIQSNRYPDVRVYLVDNASADDSIEVTLRDHPEVTVLRMPQNLGYCTAYNLAMPYALADGCEWLIWANNDVLLEPGCLMDLVHACQEHNDIGVAGPGFLAWDRDEPNSYMLGNHPQAIPALQARSEIPIDVEWVEGSFLMVSRRCLEKVGGLDPYLDNFWEEADFCRRARHQGSRVVLVPSALARHFGGASWNCSALQSQRRSLLSRNSYVYKLANPEKDFSSNLLAALHHFCVCAKGAFTSASGVLEEARSFGLALADLRAIHRKWSNDRRGKPPAPTTAAHEHTRVEVLRGESRASA